MTVFHFVFDLEFFRPGRTRLLGAAPLVDARHYRRRQLSLSYRRQPLSRAQRRNPVETMEAAPRHHRACCAGDHRRDTVRDAGDLRLLRHPAHDRDCEHRRARVSPGSVVAGRGIRGCGFRGRWTHCDRVVERIGAELARPRGAAKLCHRAGWLRVLAVPRLEGWSGNAVRFIGRHSLVYYLLHQPVLFALFWFWLQLAGR